MLQTRKHINIFNLSSFKKGVIEREREKEREEFPLEMQTCKLA